MRPAPALVAPALLLRLAGCIGVSKMPAKAPCEEVISAYAIAVFECTNDAQRADADARSLREAHACQLTGYAESSDTGAGIAAPVTVKGGGEIPLNQAFGCATRVSEVACEELLAEDPGGAWLEALDPSCDQIFGPAG